MLRSTVNWASILGQQVAKRPSFYPYSFWGCLRMTIEYVKIRNFSALAGVYDFSNFSFRAR
jgi:hypothetical protein